jgi:hypothetical protein
MAKALLFGLGIAVGGGVLWGFLMTTQISGFGGILAIVLGYMIGIGVRKGSEGRGGRGFQVLAVLLTYVGLAIGYSALILSVSAGAEGKGLGGLKLLGIGLASPVLIAIQQPWTLLILAIALWEGWRMNRGIVIDVKGPFPLGQGAAPGVKASG